MLIKLSKKLIDDIDDGNLERFDIHTEHLRYGTTSVSVSIDSWSIKKLIEFKDIVSGSTVFGSKIIVKDLETWIESIREQEKRGPDQFADMKCRKLEFFSTYLTRYFSGQKQHRIYINDEKRGVMFCSYIYDIEYHPTYRSHDGTIVPEVVTMNLAWIEFGISMESTYRFHAQDASHYITVRNALKNKNMYFANEALDRQYKKSIEKFEKVAWNVGEQYLATGSGTDDVDSENKSSYWWRSNSIVLDKNGEPANVVIDLFKESDEEENRRNRGDNVDTTYWARYTEQDGDMEEVTEDLPVHPNLVIFALRKQLCLRVHIDQLKKYVYDNSMEDKLILPKSSSDLVKTLISYKGGFQDIVRNKGGGAIVLCTGRPGTGKTLTAEVYAEVMERPLYTVQCSQLGTDPDDLEKYLLTVFSRAERWNAILLLDEADVYIRTRGDDITQNAIVGVFLRVLEYYRGVLFMTTNRPDVVDDAIASRCIARIHYQTPTLDNAKKIWRILADVQGLELDSKIIAELVKKYENLTGRDIKNVLKLVKLTQNGNKGVSMKEIEFVKQFLPTE